MQDAQTSRVGNFAQTRIDFLDQETDGCASFSPLREKAWQRFSARGIPSTREESYKYTSLRRLLKEHYHVPNASTFATPTSPPWLEQIAGLRVDTFNGELLSSQSALGVDVRSLRDYSQKNSELLQQLLNECQDHFNDASVDLNASFLSRGCYVKITATPQQPIVLVHNYGDSDLSAVMSFNVIDVAENVDVEVVEVFVGGSSSTLVNQLSSLKIARGGKLKKTQYQCLVSGGVFVDSQLTQVHKDAGYEALVLDQGGSIVRHNHDVSLSAAGANVEMNAIYLASADQHIDHHTQIDHQSPHTQSSQVYKGILRDKSRGVFNGKVVVRRNAQQSAAHQLNRNLLLGADAEVDTKPELQIDADDIKCSHGATVGRFSDDELFYLSSRGIAKHDAERLLGEAYVSDLVSEKLPDQLRGLFLGVISAFFAKGERS